MLNDEWGRRKNWMRRLYLQIYVTFLGILLLFGLLISIALYLRPPDEQDRRSLNGISTLLGEILPAVDRPLEELQAEVERLVSFPYHSSYCRWCTAGCGW